VIPLLVAGFVGSWQAHGRAPLTWDESARVESGGRLIFAIRSGDGSQLWQWVHAQTYYPFLTPTLHGWALLITGSTLAAAWVPALLGYVLAGVLAGRLARLLGAGAVGAWMAAALVWITPINARLAAGAFTENFGACAFIGTVLLLTRLERDRGVKDALSVGAVVATACWIKYDYGAVVLGFVGVAGLASLVVHRTWRTVWLYAIAGLSGVTPVMALFFAGNWHAKVRDAKTFVYQPGIPRQVDFLYYLRSLFNHKLFAYTEVGVAPVVGGLLILGLVWSLLGWRRRPELRIPVLSVGVWIVIYAFAAAKQARFIALILPVLAALTAVAVKEVRSGAINVRTASRLGLAALALVVLGASDTSLLLRLAPLVMVLTVLAVVDVAPLRARTLGLTGMAVMILGALAAVPAGRQVATQASGLNQQLSFLTENPAADQALAFVSSHPPGPLDRRVLLIGARNSLSPHALELAWSRRLGRASPGVEVVPEAPPEQRRDAVVDAIRRIAPSRIVVVESGASSRLLTDKSVTGEEVFPSQHAYATIVADLGAHGLLTLESSHSLEIDPLRIDFWTVQPAALSGTLRVVTTPAVPATIAVDGTARDGFGLGTDLTIGDHEVCFGAQAGYDPPPCQTVRLLPGGTASVTGRYLPRPGAPPSAGSGGWLTVARPVLMDAGTVKSTYTRRIRIFRDADYRVKIAGHDDHVNGFSRTRSLRIG